VGRSVCTAGGAGAYCAATRTDCLLNIYCRITICTCLFRLHLHCLDLSAAGTYDTVKDLDLELLEMNLELQLVDLGLTLICLLLDFTGRHKTVT